MKLVGDKALARMFKRMPLKVQRNVTRRAVRRGANIIKAEARRLAPKRTGLMARSIVVKGSRSRSPFVVRMKVTTRAGLYKGKAYYAAFQEFGWRTGKRRPKSGDRRIARREIPGRHFMEHAADSKWRETAETIMREWRVEIVKEAGK